MSKTIEIASRHKGLIATKVKGEPVSVEFKATDTPDVFLAMVDNDTAGAFLAIGRPDYWKPTVDADGEGNEKTFVSASDVIAKIRGAVTLEELEALIEGEERKSVLDEAAKKSKVLSK